MKKQRNYAWLAFLIVLLLAAIPSFGPAIWELFDKPVNGIIKATTDERGLTSIEYVQDGKTFALDYLDAKELDSVKATVKCPGCPGPLPRPCPYGTCGITMHCNYDLPCMCCAVKPGGVCIAHSSTKTDTIK